MRLFDIFSVPVWRSGPDAKCDYFNRAWLDFTGRTLEQEIGDGWSKGVHPDDLDACLGDYLRAFAASESFVLEYRLRRHDGKYRWVVDHGAPFSDEMGKFQGYIGTCYDITERREVEDGLRRSERRFSAFMDNLPAFAWMKDLEGRYLYTNKQLEQLEPYRDAGAIGKTDAEIWPVEFASGYQANDRAAITTRKALQAVESYFVGDERHSVLVSKFPILDQDGSLMMVGGTSVEVTNRIHAEQALSAQILRYKTLMETSNDSICVLDANGNLQEANAEFLRRRGYSVDEGKGLNVADWDAQWTPDQLKERMRQLVDGNAIFETQHRCKDGSVFDVEVAATSVRIANKQLFFCVTRDITERKRTEEALRQANQQLQVLSRRRAEVLEDERRHLSRELHDQIGQSLMAAKMNLRSMPRLRKREKIVARLDDTMAILDQILQQIRQISFDLRPPVLDDLGLAPALQWVLRHQAERAGLSVEFIADVELKRPDPEVETACFRIALEALTNVIRHARARKVFVGLSRVDGSLQLIVRDDGVGFDLAGAANRTRRDRLGLAGMDERVMVLGGTFQCKSAPGQGTEVQASFPTS